MRRFSLLILFVVSLCAAQSQSANNYTVNVRWTLYPAPASHINVWMGSSSTSFVLVSQVPSSSTVASVGGLRKNHNYYFKLTAVDTNSLESASSAIVIYRRT